MKSLKQYLNEALDEKEAKARRMIQSVINDLTAAKGQVDAFPGAGDWDECMSELKQALSNPSSRNKNIVKVRNILKGALKGANDSTRKKKIASLVSAYDTLNDFINGKE